MFKGQLPTSLVRLPPVMITSLYPARVLSSVTTLFQHGARGVGSTMATTGNGRDANWVDGLRGIASFLVVTGHICTAFVEYLHSPAMGEHKPPSIFQLPYLRLIVGGRASVAFFFLISGYVNSLQTIEQARKGQMDSALVRLSKSGLTRTGRLVLPTAVASFISWVLAHIGAYKITSHVDATWIRQGAHKPEPNFWAAIYSLAWSEVRTWINVNGRGFSEYDGTQWTLILFLEGSFIVYMTLLATLYCTSRSRRVILGLLWVYSWISGDALKCCNIFAGMMLAEVHAEYNSRATTMLRAPIPFLLIVGGAFLCCYPRDNQHWTTWSETMFRIGDFLIPRTVERAFGMTRYFDSVGATMIIFGCFFSAGARKFLSQPLLNFMGRVSFAVYLTHNQVIKTVLTWMVYARSAMGPVKLRPDGSRHDLERAGLPTFAIAIPVFFYVLYRLAYLWILYVDPWCAKMTARLKNIAFGVGDPQQLPPSEKTIIPS